MAIIIIELLLLGICLGSFVNAFVYRFHRQEEIELALAGAVAETVQPGRSGKDAKTKRQHQTLAEEARRLSISRGRSLCPHCGHELAAKDLVPILSYVWLRGRCRYCRQSIDDTPLPELLTPLMFVVSYLYWPYSLQGSGWLRFAVWLIVLVGLVILTLYDLRWFLLPDRIVLPLIGLAMAEVIIRASLLHGGWPAITGAVYGALVGGGLFYVLHIVSKGAWIGGGDVTLGLLLGILVGGPGGSLLLIFLASLIGTLVALPLLATGRAQRTTHLPFGPFLILAAVIVQLFGKDLIHLYTSYFLGVS